MKQHLFYAIACIGLTLPALTQAQVGDSLVQVAKANLSAQLPTVQLSTTPSLPQDLLSKGITEGIGNIVASDLGNSIQLLNTQLPNIQLPSAQLPTMPSISQNLFPKDLGISVPDNLPTLDTKGLEKIAVSKPLEMLTAYKPLAADLLKLPTIEGINTQSLAGELGKYSSIKNLKTTAKAELLQKLGDLLPLPSTKLEKFVSLEAGMSYVPAIESAKNLNVPSLIGNTSQISQTWLKGILGLQVQGAIARFESMKSTLPSINTTVNTFTNPEVWKELALMGGPLISIPIAPEFKLGAFAQGGLSVTEANTSTLNTTTNTPNLAALAQPTIQALPTWKVGASMTWQHKKVGVSTALSMSRFTRSPVQNTGEYPINTNTNTTPPVETNPLAYTATIGLTYKIEKEDKPKKDSTKQRVMAYYFEPTLTYPSISTTIVKDTLDLAFVNSYAGGTHYDLTLTTMDKSIKTAHYELQGFWQNGQSLLHLSLKEYAVQPNTIYLLTIKDGKKTFFFQFIYQPKTSSQYKN
jgi:hypothetical protein